MPPKPGALKDPKKRKLLIYGGLAVAMLAVYLITRKSSSSGSSSTSAQDAANQAAQQAAANQAAQDASSGVGSLGTGAGGVDPSAQLAGLDSDVQTLSQQVADWQNGQTTPGPTTSSTDNPFADFLSGIGAGVSLYQAGYHAGPGGSKKKTRTQTKPKPGHRGQDVAPKKRTGRTTTTARGAHKHTTAQKHAATQRKRRR